MGRFVILITALLLGSTAIAQEPELDPVSGLKMRGDWELVRNMCSACHSTRLITQQSGDADQWLGLIRWMQAEQNLWQFDPETEARIIDYLAENYPPQAEERRAPIPAELMPPKRNFVGHGRHGGCKKAQATDCGRKHHQAE
jgi:hypothetical protein